MENEGFSDENGQYVNGKAGNGFHNGSLPEHEKSGAALPGQFTVANEKAAKVDEEDPWKVTSLSQDYVSWSELDSKKKCLRVLGYTVKIVLVIGCLYMFICSLDFLSSAFRLLGGEAAGQVFQQSDIMTNPVAGLMMGVLVTVLVQSSSTSTSIIVSMVGAGILDIKTAIPIVMGANIGTSVTNTIVAVGQISDKGEFRRAFAGATVHDMFNWLTVIIMLPLEIATGYLFRLSDVVMDSLPLDTNKGAKQDILKVITKPFTELIIQVNKDAITKIASNSETDKAHELAIIKICCDKESPEDCCEKEMTAFREDDSHSNDFGFLRSVGSYSNASKSKVCDELHHCVSRDRANPSHSSCLTEAWQYTNISVPTPVQKIDCSSFGGNATETECCTNIMDSMDQFYLSETYLESDFSKACGSVSSCFSSAGSNFSSPRCMDSWVNGTGVLTQLGDQFSCLDWSVKVEKQTCKKECDFLFKGLYPDLDEKAIGGILLVVSLAILCICLVCIVKLLHTLLKGPMAILIKTFINADFPGVAAYFTGYLAIIIGAGLTIVVQSSSIFTSTLTPLVGIGVIELDRMYPLTLGSNIGTTTTAILSALANSGGKLRNSLQVAFCHLFFNITGIIIFYPLPFLRFPIPMAKFLGNCTAKYRWFAIVYIFAMFFIFPATVFALSIPGWYVLAAILGPIVLIIIVIGIIKCLQAKYPKVLPNKLKNWKFLPKGLRSLEPYNNVMAKVFFCKRFQQMQEVPEEKGNHVENHVDSSRL